MTPRRLVYGLVLLVLLAAAAAFRYSRYNDVELPIWAYALGAAVAAGGIAFDVWWRKQSAQNASESSDQSRSEPPRPEV
ncbi:MAG TPA: hypothetical protein VFJ83_06930 [Nocardioidaceae bacterium]|nr:hypothetical protein [Nocardioidaceae bacterium]